MTLDIYNHMSSCYCLYLTVIPILIWEVALYVHLASKGVPEGLVADHTAQLVVYTVGQYWTKIRYKCIVTVAIIFFLWISFQIGAKNCQWDSDLQQEMQVQHNYVIVDLI